MKMVRQNKKLSVPDPMVVAKRKELAEKIAALTRMADERPTAIPELTLFRRPNPTPCYKATYEPSITVFVQGRKRINLGGEGYLCDESSFLLSSIDVPVQSQVVGASEDVPLLSCSSVSICRLCAKFSAMMIYHSRKRLLIVADWRSVRQLWGCIWLI